MKHYVSHFSVDRQGTVKKIKEVVLEPPQSKVNTDVSNKPMLETEIANMVDGAVVSHLNNKVDAIGQNLSNAFDVRFNKIEAHLGITKG
jgi:hypothetical protein